MSTKTNNEYFKNRLPSWTIEKFDPVESDRRKLTLRTGWPNALLSTAAVLGLAYCHELGFWTLLFALAPFMYPIYLFVIVWTLWAVGYVTLIPLAAFIDWIAKKFKRTR